jgi:ABC-type antimicrobial peptide transport system permease subunit
MRLAGLGVIAGVMLAVPLAQLLTTLLFGVAATDPVTFLSVGLGVFLVCATACCVPARRALAIQPTEALRID